jgi:COP9 signalosome complex subunit 4
VKITECFLAEDEIAEADSSVNKAGSVVESISNPEKHLGLILRYKSTYARVLDNNRKFLQAAGRYHDLSDQSNSNLIPADDLLRMLGNAATCAILSPSGPQRQRVLGHIYKDARLNQLDSLPEFETHATILKKMFKFQILEKDELVKFEASLQEHQKARMGDGLTIMERGVVEHNMISAAQIYKTIYVSELAVKLGVSAEKAEKIAANMIMEGSLEGSIDQVDGLVEFFTTETPNSSWDKAISNFCMDLNRITETIQAK